MPGARMTKGTEALLTLAELKEEVAFWKAETLECRNVLADVVNDRGELEAAALEAAPGALVAMGKDTAQAKLNAAAVKYSRSFAKAEKKKNPRRK